MPVESLCSSLILARLLFKATARPYVLLMYANKSNVSILLRPVFEHLRLAKQSFKAGLEKLDGTLQTRSERAKQALQNICPDVSQLVDYGTRKKLLNTKIEPNFNSSKKGNVEEGI